MPEPTVTPIITSAITSTIDLSYYIGLFSAPSITPTEVVTVSLDFMPMFEGSAPFIPFVISTVLGAVVNQYLGLKLAFTALVMLLGFVLTKIGLPGGAIGYRQSTKRGRWR